MNMPLTKYAISITTLILLTGCHALNESATMRGADPIPALQNTPPTNFTGGQTLTGIDRSDWPATPVRVSMNDSENQATYGTWWLLNDQQNRRDKGLYPTTTSALDVPNSPHDTKMQYAEMFFEPVHQLINIGLIPYFEIFKKQPGTIERGPSHQFQRELPAENNQVELTPKK